MDLETRHRVQGCGRVTDSGGEEDRLEQIQECGRAVVLSCLAINIRRQVRSIDGVCGRNVPQGKEAHFTISGAAMLFCQCQPERNN